MRVKTMTKISVGINNYCMLSLLLPCFMPSGRWQILFNTIYIDIICVCVSRHRILPGQIINTPNVRLSNNDHPSLSLLHPPSDDHPPHSLRSPPTFRNAYDNRRRPLCPPPTPPSNVIHQNNARRVRAILLFAYSSVLLLSIMILIIVTPAGYIIIAVQRMKNPRRTNNTPAVNIIIVFPAPFPPPTGVPVPDGGLPYGTKGGGGRGKPAVGVNVARPRTKLSIY